MCAVGNENCMNFLPISFPPAKHYRSLLWMLHAPRFCRFIPVSYTHLIPRVLECLPGANCGGCGYAGCEAMAQAMVAGNAPADGCPVCDAGAKEEIANILGISTSPTSPQHAQVLCRGTVQAAKKKFAYEGIHDCIAAAKLFGGDKQCAYGCLGYGTCVSACPFHAIVLQDGVAVVKEQDCRSCGVCVNVCPKHLFELLPADTAIFVGCRAKDRGAQTRQNCTAVSYTHLAHRCAMRACRTSG